MIRVAGLGLPLVSPGSMFQDEIYDDDTLLATPDWQDDPYNDDKLDEEEHPDIAYWCCQWVP